MIFLTVGHQTPFDRLIVAMDQWAAQNPTVSIEAQIGNGEYLPQHFPYTRWLDSAQFEASLKRAEFIVAHAGTGTIISALEKGKPVLVLPRLAALSETRNDHQVGTARYFAEAGLVQSVDSDEKLSAGLSRLFSWRPSNTVSKTASKSLLTRLADFASGVDSEQRPN